MIENDDLELVRWAVRKTEGKSDRKATELVGVSAATLKGWRERINAGEERQIAPLRKPTRTKLLSKRAASEGENRARYTSRGSPPVLSAPVDLLIIILDRESRSAEIRATAMSTHADAFRIAEEAARDRAAAAKEWAVAARLAEENARELRRLVSSDPEVDRIADQGETALIEEEEAERTGGAPQRPAMPPRETQRGETRQNGQ